MLRAKNQKKTLDGLPEGDVFLVNLNKIWKKRVTQKDCGKEEYLAVEEIIIKFLEQKKDFGEAYHKLGNIYYRRKFYEDAEKCYRAALEKNKKWENQNDKAWCYHDLGYLLYLTGDHKKAVGNYTKAIEIAKKAKDEKSIAWFYKDRGTAFMKLERYDAAEKDFDDAYSRTRNDKDKAYVYNALGRLCYRKKLYNTARKKLVLAKEHNPDNNLGLLDLEKGSYENAKKKFQKAIEMDKSEKKECENLAEAHLNLGDVFFMEENYKEADKEYEEAIRID
jgi:tetratricopeptide (TPR) repeat protein